MQWLEVRRASGSKRRRDGAQLASRARPAADARPRAREAACLERQAARSEDGPAAMPALEPGPAQPCSVSQRSASIAAMQPVPAAVIAWRYTLSVTSPHANTPATFV